MTTTLRKRKEAQVIRKFHEIIDDYDAISSSDFPNRPMVHYEFQERAIIAEMLCLTATDQYEKRQRIKFISNLAGYCARMETRQNGPQPSQAYKSESTQEIQQSAVPMFPGDRVCLICMGNEPKRALRSFSTRDTLHKHLGTHVREGIFDTGFTWLHPSRSEWIEGVQHFQNHAGRAHSIHYPHWKRT